MRVLPVLGAPPRLPPLRVAASRLANGIPLHSVERRELPLVDVEFILPRGAEHDAGNVAGRFSLMAEMLDEGTATRDALQIAEQLDYLGAHLDVQAGWDTTTASLHVLSHRLPEALDIMCDVLLRPAFDAREFQRKQTERIDALYQDEDDAAIVAAKALARGVFGAAHPYGTSLHGTVAGISTLTAAALRQTYGTLKQDVQPVVIVVGDIDASQMTTLLQERLGEWSGGRPNPGATIEQPASQPRRVLLVDKPGAAQAELRAGHAGPPRLTSDYFALTVMNTILGGAFTSRLNTILRERMGVTYGASSHFRLRRNGGLFSAGSAVFTESAARSAQVVVEEMIRMVEESVPADELRRAQSYLALGLPRQFETNEEVATHVREQVLYDLPADYWQTYMDHVFSVTADDVRNAAARHLHPDETAIVVVADAKQVRGALAATGLGDVIETTVET